MMEQEYRREMDQVKLTAEQRARMVQAMVEEPPQRRRKYPPVRLLLAAVLACGVLTTSALALSPGLRDSLVQALGSFAPYSQKLEGTVVADQNVKIQVVSAVSDQYRMKLYVEVEDLTGEYFTDDRIRMWWNVPRQWGKTRISSIPYCIAYSPEAHTALFELEQSGYRQAEESEELELTIDWIQAGRYQIETTEDLPVELLSSQYLETMTLENGDLVLVPEQTPAELEGAELFRLSSLGFAPDGTLQGIFQLSDEVVPADEDNTLLGSNHLIFTAYVDGKILYGKDAEVKEYFFTWNGKQYLGLGQEVPKEYRDHVTLTGVYGTLLTQSALEPLKGPWTISFPVENISGREIQLTGAVGEGTYPTTLILSPLGAMITGGYDMNIWGGESFAVIYEDGTRFESLERRHTMFSSDELCVLGNWEFTEPLDLERVMSVEVGNWHIPLIGPEAGVVRSK